MTDDRRRAVSDGLDAADGAVLSVTFDRRSSVPLYQQLKYHIVHAISTGRMQPRSALPSVRVVSRGLGIASATVQRAYADLQAEGFVVAEPGRGVFVAELDAEQEVDEATRRQSLRDVLLPTVRQAQSLGFTSREILDEVSALTAVDGDGIPAPRVVFVGRRPEAVQKYVRLLRAGLAATSAEVTGIELQTLQDADGEAFDDMGPSDLLVSLVSTFAEVRSEARRRGLEAYGLMVELSHDTKRALLELPFDVQVGLLAESVFMSNTRALVEQLRGHTSDLVWATDEDAPAEVSRALARCDVVLHTLGMAELAEQASRPGTRLIELTFLPMQASLAHLADTIVARSAGMRAKPQEAGAR